MDGDKNSYSNILKAIGLFGGVKVFQILVGIIKNKFIAVLLGPAGMGISGMITSTTSLISTLTGFGLHTSSVRDIAQATCSQNEEKIGRVTAILRKLVLLTGLLGTAITFCLAKYLSIWAFGNEDFTVAFRIVSSILFIDQLCIGQTALMQGTFHYKFMASASLIGSIVGLVVSVPLYYLWGVRAIVPVIVLSSVVNLLFSWFYTNKIKIQKVRITPQELSTEGRGMLRLGLAIALTGVVTVGQTYILRLFISNYGNIADVGLYSAGIGIATSYINVVLSAMGSDYSPRLASMTNDNQVFIETINRQTKLMITIMAPLIVVFIVFIKQLTILLYSTKFIAISGMVEWMMFAMSFRAVSWCLSFAQVARGESKVFFWNEFATSIYSLLFSIVGYKLAGFTGMGIAFFMTYLCYCIQMLLLCRKRFQFRFSSDSLKILLFQIVLLGATFIVLQVVGYETIRYVIGAAAILLITCISYRQLNTMIPIRQMFNSLMRRIKC